MPLPNQPLFQFARPGDREDLLPSAAEWLVSFLAGKDFVTAKDILIAMRMPVNEDNKRWLRRVRVATAGRVVGGPGFPGYVLLRNMTAVDFAHWKNSMRAQAREMIRESIRAEKLYHQLAAA
jgi:hypothetical protein